MDTSDASSVPAAVSGAQPTPPVDLANYSPELVAYIRERLQEAFEAELWGGRGLVS